MRRLHFRRPIIGRLTIGLSVVAALALMSVGWSGLAGLTAHPARLGVVATIVSGGCVFLFCPCQLFAGGRREVRRQRYATFAAIGLIGGLCWLLPYADRHDWMVWPENPLVRYAGLVGAVVGIFALWTLIRAMNPHTAEVVRTMPESV